MPYESIEDLPPAVQSALSTGEEKQKFLGAFNSCMYDKNGDESACFKIGYAAARKAIKTDLPIAKALVIAKRHLPGWAWSILRQDDFSVAKSAMTIGDVRKIFSYSIVQEIRGEPHNQGVKPLYCAGIIEKLNNRNLIHKALSVSRGTMPGWACATLRQHFTGQPAPVVFVCKDLKGKALEIFKRVYIPLLGLESYSICEKSDSIDQSGSIIIALGKSAGADQCDAKLPHPKALLLFGDSGEVARKIPKMRKMIDSFSLIMRHSEKALRFKAEPSGDLSQDDTNLNRFIVPIAKANPDKQIVTGIVLEPWSEDSQNDILTPDVIERAAHLFMAKSRVIGLEHSKEASGAIPVESYVVPYPTVEDYKRATEGSDHTAYSLQLGEQSVKSGSWVLSTKLDDSLWELFKSGEVTAYSIGGYGKRVNHEVDKMPAIKYVEASVNGNGPRGTGSVGS